MGSAQLFGVAAIAACGVAACSTKDLSEFNAGGAAGAGSSTSSGGSSGTAGQGGTGSAGASGGSGGATGGSGGCSSQTLTTAWMSPADAEDGGPGGAWIFESRVDKSDDQRAKSTIMGSGNTSVLRAFGFGFQIPNTATILGIELAIERSASVGSAIGDLSVRLGMDGSAFSVTKAAAAAWPTADAYNSYGSATDTWSIPGLSPIIVNSKLFDAHLTARCDEASACAPGVEARVDHMRMRITYQTTCN